MAGPTTPPKPAARHGAAGFTLIEVLVAIVIMSIMAVMAWQGVDGIVRTRDASQARLEQTLRLNTVIAQWEHDLASIQKTTAVPSELVCDGATLRLTRRAPGGLQIVAWSLRPELGSSVLQRWASPAVTTTAELSEHWLRSLQLQGNEPGQISMLSGLAQWQVYFYQGTAWANCQSSGDDDRLPSGVRLVLSFAPDSGLAGELLRDVRIDP